LFWMIIFVQLPYIVPAKTYERLMDLAEDIELGRIIEERKDEKKEAVEVGIDDL